MVDKGIKGNGFIHISHYIPGKLPSETPYIEIEWKTKLMSPLYNFYYNYLNDLITGKHQVLQEIPVE